MARWVNKHLDGYHATCVRSTTRSVRRIATPGCSSGLRVPGKVRTGFRLDVYQVRDESRHLMFSHDSSARDTRNAHAEALLAFIVDAVRFGIPVPSEPIVSAHEFRRAVQLRRDQVDK
jgi:hypothetical protein